MAEIGCDKQGESIKERCAKALEREADKLAEDPNNGYVENDTNAFIWTNDDAEAQDYYLREHAALIRAMPDDGEEPIATLHDDGCWTWKKGMPPWESNFAGWRLDVYARPSQMAKRPRIICLCGSTRFIEHFAVLQWTLEKEGYITLGLHLLPASYPGVKPDHMAEAEGIKQQMDDLHKRKIDLADEILVVNIGGYIGESTMSEIDYATHLGKPIKYIERIEGGGQA